MNTNEYAHTLRVARSDGNGSLLCLRESQPGLHPCLWIGVHARFDLWLLAGSLSIWRGRGVMVRRSNPSLVARKGIGNLAQ
jgi:hypothetical protein